MNILKKLKSLGVDAEVIEFEENVRTAKDASKKLNVPINKIVKSVLLILDERKRLLCILSGSDKIDFNKLRKIYGIRNIRTATAEEVLNYTGYPVGGVIPFIPEIETILEEKVLRNKIVYAGGGTTNTLLKTTPAEIKKFAKVVLFSKQEQ